MKVVVVGAGFGGLSAVKNLAGSGHDVLLIDRNNYHLFQPLLYQVATAGLDAEAVAYPVRALVRRLKGVRFRMAQVAGVDFDRRVVRTDGGEIPYDRLVLAAGSASNYFGLESVRREAHDLKELSDAVGLRNDVLRAFENASRETDPARRAAWLTFVVVGAGPTGVEFSGALAELVRHALTRDHPDIRRDEVKIVVVEAGADVLAALAPRLRAYALAQLRSRGIEVRLGAAVAAATPERVTLKDGSEIPARTLLWAAGVKAAPLADALGLERKSQGRVLVGPDLSVPGRPEVFVIGDLAHLDYEGRPLPMMAPAAIQQGAYVARRLVAEAKGRPAPPPFRYRDKGAMAVIGRHAAVAQAFGLSLRGFPAWVTWLFLHLMYLVGFRNRALTLLNWSLDYFLYDRKVRLITDEPRPEPPRAPTP